MNIDDLLRSAVAKGASDLHLKVGAYPMMRLSGALVPLDEAKRLDNNDTLAMGAAVMSPAQREKYKETQEIDLAYSVAGLGRFRCNIFQQRGTMALVLRVIPTRILTVDDLLLPPVLRHICEEERGLVLVTGTTGSGKSTTLAAMIDHINNSRCSHVMTVEDPIEFLHRDSRSIVAASVVLLPLPVVPVTSTSPRSSSAMRLSTGGSPSSSIVRICIGMTRRTRPTVPRC